MGLFGFGKKKEEPALKSAKDFYAECLTDFHDALAAKGYATKGVIFIPELIPFGNKAILAYLKDPFFQMEAGNNVTQYYYLICALSFMTGVAYADKWHSNFAELNNGFVDQIITAGPPEYAQPVLEKATGLNRDEQAEKLFATVFNRWIKIHEPYWQLRDPREYTFNAMLAAYQAGISTILEKYGY